VNNSTRVRTGAAQQTQPFHLQESRNTRVYRCYLRGTKFNGATVLVYLRFRVCTYRDMQVSCHEDLRSCNYQGRRCCCAHVTLYTHIYSVCCMHKPGHHTWLSTTARSSHTTYTLLSLMHLYTMPYTLVSICTTIPCGLCLHHETIEGAVRL
jgi:hypothetical protein